MKRPTGAFSWSAISGALLFLAIEAGAEQESVGTRCWTGTVIGNHEQEVVVEQDAAYLLERLEETLLAFKVDRGFSAARMSLDGLRVQASRMQEFEDQGKVMLQVAVARAKLFRDAGQLEQAREALQVLLLPENQSTAWAGRFPLTAAPPRLLALAASVVADPRIVELRQSLEQEAAEDDDLGLDPEILKYVRRHFGSPSKEMLKSVEQAAITGANKGLISQLKHRSTPALAVLVLKDPAGTTYLLDPLSNLLATDPIGGSRLVKDHLHLGGLQWRLRLLQMLETYRFLHPEQRRWRGDPKAPEHAEWLDVLAELVEDDITRPRAMSFVAGVARVDALHGRLLETLLDEVSQPEVDRPLAVFRALPSYRIDSSLPLVERVLDPDRGHSSAELRRLAAHKINLWPVNEVLRSRIDDPDTQVRREVARSLSRRNGSIYKGGINSGSLVVPAPEIGQKEERLLRRLLQDPDVEVRSSAVVALAGGEVRLDPELYRMVFAYPEPEVRALLAQIRCSDPAFVIETMLRLAQDPDPRVLQAVDRRLRQQVDWERDFAMWFPVWEARMSHATIPYLSYDNWTPGDILSNLSDEMFESPDSILPVTRFALARASNDYLEVALQSTYYLRNSNGGLYERFLELDATDLAALLIRGNDIGGEHIKDQLWSIAHYTEPRPRDALALVVGSDRADVTTRLHAASLMPLDAELRAALMPVLSHRDFQTRGPTSTERKYIRELYGTDSDRIQLVEAVLADSEVTEPLVMYVCERQLTEVVVGQHLNAQIFDRWFREEGPRVTAVASAILALGHHPADEPDRVLLATKTLEYVESAVNAMRRRADPAYLPVMGELLTSAAVPVKTKLLIVEVIAGYDPEISGPLLLDGLARCSSSNLSVNIEQQLDRIRRYKEERARFDNLDHRVVQRDQAVGELLTLLENSDPEIRAAAISGLATLGAVETIPRIIPLLRDKDPAVVQAARNAIKRFEDTPPKETQQTADDNEQ